MLYSNVGMNHATQGGDPDDKIILYRTFKEINNVPLIISSLKENYFPQRKETRKIMNTENLLLQPNEYWFCKQQISELVSAYHSVNDKQTIVTLQTLIKGKRKNSSDAVLCWKPIGKNFLIPALPVKNSKSF